jgi:hypothetical protein
MRPRRPRSRSLVAVCLLGVVVLGITFAVSRAGDIPYPATWASDVSGARDLARDVSGGLLPLRLVEIQCQETVTPSRTAILTFRPLLSLDSGDDIYIASSQPTAPAPGGVDQPAIMTRVDSESRDEMLASRSYGACPSS